MLVHEKAAAFASPLSGDAAADIHSFTRGRRSATCRRIAEGLRGQGGSRAETAEQLLAFGTGKQRAWRPESGHALIAAREGNFAAAALQLAASFASSGGTGALSVDIDQPSGLYLDGWLGCVSGRCTLTADGTSVVVAGAVEARFERAGSYWRSTGGLGGVWPTLSTDRVAPAYLIASDIWHGREGYPWTPEPPSAWRPAGPQVQTPDPSVIQQGWDLVLSAAPEYGLWIAQTTIGVLVVGPSGPNHLTSGSSPDHPGLIAMSMPHDAISCGEVLVHESSHQHLMILKIASPLVEHGSDEESYSPIKGLTRPIERVLIGAHAVGNMVIYHRLLEGRGASGPEAARRLAVLTEWFEADYRPALDQAKSLTASGQAVWRSLVSTVDAVHQEPALSVV